jgi:hypothetical protein
VLETGKIKVKKGSGNREAKARAESREAAGKGEAMPVARPEPQEPRVIAHLDLDCFYVQGNHTPGPPLSFSSSGSVSELRE